MPADDLIALIEQLGAPYGLERSIKIAPGRLFDDRCLISIHRTALGDRPADRLADIGHKLAIPAAFAARLPVALEGADILHFGHEGGSGYALRKIYFEYATRARRAMATSNAPVLVHLAYKWTPESADRASVARYTWMPCRTRQDIEAKLRVLLAAAPRALTCALRLVSQAARAADAGQMMMMEVEEAENPRRSCDLNLYDAELNLGQISDLITATMADFAIPQSRIAALIERGDGIALGHLSAGMGRDGEEFVTIYYGIEAH